MADAILSPGQKLLIFIVAYNAEKTLAQVLDRIPESLKSNQTEILIIDDFSSDETFYRGVDYEGRESGWNIRTLKTPENQGYGGNQKLGYRYAIENGFDFVALIHGDGQYAPEKLPDLLVPLVEGKADVVFGSRMMNEGGARAGGMPLYKYIGNKILTSYENRMLGTDFSEFHSGYRLYSVNALKEIPFERNTNDFHFDTEIIIQLVLAELRIVELPIPTYYGDEICHVNGMKYAWDVFKAILRARFHQMNLLYDRKYDLAPPEETYDLKLGYDSSHTRAIDAVPNGSNVLDIGCGRGYIAQELLKKGCEVVGLDQYAAPLESLKGKFEIVRCDLDAHPLPVDVSQYDRILMLDIIEHLHDPEGFMEDLRHSTRTKRPEIILTTANIGFFIPRLMLFLGQFNYGRKGILDRTHTRLFTFRTLRDLLKQSGYQILEVSGIPGPFPKALGENALGFGLLRCNQLFLKLLPGVFSYQIYIRARALPTVQNLLIETEETSAGHREGYVSQNETSASQQPDAGLLQGDALS